MILERYLWACTLLIQAFWKLKPDFAFPLGSTVPSSNGTTFGWLLAARHR